MSCFICSEKTISNITYYICEFPELCPEIMECLGTNGLADPHKIFASLCDLNELAYTERYKTADPMELRLHRGKYKAPKSQSEPDLIEVIVGLECFLYQCFEGNVPDTELFSALVAFQGRLCRKLVCDDPNYAEDFGKYWQ